jgi:hypothetical protein
MISTPYFLKGEGKKNVIFKIRGTKCHFAKLQERLL